MPAEKSDGELNFSLNDGSSRRLRTWREVHQFIDEVDDAWAWLRGLPAESDPANIRGQVPTRIQKLRTEAQQAQNAGQQPRDLEVAVLNTFNGGGGVFLPDSESGVKILDIRDAGGPEAAATALAFLRGHIHTGNITRPGQFLGLIMLALPGTAPIVDGGQRLAKERENLRSTTRRLAREVEEAEAARAREWQDFTTSSKAAALRWAQRRARRLLRKAREWGNANEASIEKISGVERSYREFMKLKAPVEYWEAKAAEHGRKEGDLRTMVGAYFLVALAGIVTMFLWTAEYIVAATTAGRTLPPGLFFIISAGLASAAGLLFWVGRLLTKLYLSEHHLRHDAEERAKMTQTYLALTAEGAAISEADRQIILTALFRNTPDGIVKEEGGLDPTLAAALARFLSKP